MADKENNNPHFPSRRDFLKFTLLAVLSTFLPRYLSGCSNPEDNVYPENDIEREKLEKLLETCLGSNWEKIVANEVSNTIPAGENPTDNITAGLVATALTSEVFANPVLDRIKISLINMGDLNLQDIIEASAGGIKELAIKMEMKGTHGGFVVYHPTNDAWYKFFSVSDNGRIDGYHNQAMKLWERNLKLWGISNGLSSGRTIIAEQEYIYYRTPNVGCDTLQHLVESKAYGSNTIEVANNLLKEWYRQSLMFIQDGKLSAVHFDPNPGNLVLHKGPNGEKLASIDFDYRPMGFDSRKTAATAFSQMVEGAYKRTEYGISPEDMASIFSEVFGDNTEYTNLKSTLRMTNIPTDIPLGDEGHVNIRYFFNTETRSKISSQSFVSNFSEAINDNPDALPERLKVKFVTTSGEAVTCTKEVSMYLNSGASSLKPISRLNLKAAEMIEATRPYLKAGIKLLDIVAIFSVFNEFLFRQTHPYATVDRRADNSIETGKLGLILGKGIIQSLLRNHAYLVMDILDDMGYPPVNPIPILRDAVTQTSEITGLPLMDSEYSRSIQNCPDENPNTTCFQENIMAVGEISRIITNEILNIINQMGVWDKLHIDGMSAIPLMGMDVDGNIYARITRAFENNWTLTLATANNKNSKTFKPCIEVPLVLDDEFNLTRMDSPSVLDANQILEIKYGPTAYILDLSSKNAPHIITDKLLTLLFRIK